VVLIGPTIVIGIIVTGINSIVIGYLCMHIKTISMLLVGVRIVKADFIFSLAETSPSTAKPNMISAELIWQAVKNALTDLIGVETLLILIFILLFIGLLMKLFKTKKAISKTQTKLYIHFECPLFALKKHLLDLAYSSDYYEIEIQNRMIQFKHFGFIGYIQLNGCIKIINKLTKLNVFVADTIYVFPLEQGNKSHVCKSISPTGNNSRP